MWRKHLLWPAAGMLIFIILACTGGGTLPVGTKAPEFGIKRGDNVVALSDYQGQVVIVNFWSST